MKKLVLMMLFACACAQADTLATMGNAAGGTVILTDVPCKNGGGYYVYSQSPTASTQFGCWWSDDSMVHITWNDGDVRSYPINYFKVNSRIADRLRARENGNRPTY